MMHQLFQTPALLLAAAISNLQLGAPRDSVNAIENLFKNDCRRAQNLTLVVRLNRVDCRMSDAEVGKISCEVHGERGAKTVGGHQAYEIASLLKAAGVTENWGLGSRVVSARNIYCELDLRKIGLCTGDGAECILDASQ